MKTLSKIKIEGFKSIESAELTLGDLNVVIGANGSGKSNLIGVFRLVERVLAHNLQLYVASEPDRFLFHGRKKTPALSLDFDFEISAYYGFELKAVRDSFVFSREFIFDNGSLAEEKSTGAKESLLVEDQQFSSLFMALQNLEVFHIQDTADSSPVRKTADIDDNRFFCPNAANLPAYLYWLQEKHPVEFRHIEEHIRLVAPFFDCFVLAPSKLNEKKIKLEWRQKGSDAYFDAYSLSDGTLRFICLATLLLQPNPPALILLDEPELGLHPFAIRILAEMLEAASKRVQVLLATQSVTLLNNFALQDVIVAENDGMKTTFSRLDEEKLKGWLEDFSLGELWEKNVLGGRP
ncbi:MAG: AAA family ATPase [Betaproteobacteria bacterium]|nr:AAA family ATPase [Betaproteobacteria bacterium]